MEVSSPLLVLAIFQRLCPDSKVIEQMYGKFTSGSVVKIGFSATVEVFGWRNAVFWEDELKNLKIAQLDNVHLGGFYIEKQR